MDIGVGLPTTVPGCTGPALTGWARRAEHLGFASLGVLDRLVYDNYEPVVALAAAAAVTERIRLAATILIAAYRDSPAVLAKQLATVDHLSGGRLVVGLAAGGREDDYVEAGTTYHDRGKRLDDVVATLHEVWQGDTVGPAAAPPLIMGGHSPAAMRRAAAHGQGWIGGGSSTAGFAALAEQARLAWKAAGREDQPRMMSLGYVSLGPDGRERAQHYLRAYYAFAGPKAEMAAAGAITDAGRLRETIAAYAEAGCDELILFPCTTDAGQLDLIAAEALP
jgi:alkanesulfonate monooxygenase SsuD/methylene tetrahydromethanopterin reductase-like flavin-dependent oxidoreductase (luciferase family)